MSSNEEPTTDRLVSRTHAAEILDVSPDTIRRYARDRGLLREVFIGGHSRYRLSDVMKLVEEGDGAGQMNLGRDPNAIEYDNDDPHEEALTDAERNPSLGGSDL